MNKKSQKTNKPNTPIAGIPTPAKQTITTQYLKQIILLVLSACLLYLYAWQLPENRIWLDKEYTIDVTLPNGKVVQREDGRIPDYYLQYFGDEERGFTGQREILDIEKRKFNHWKMDFVHCATLQATLADTGVLLIPPQTYLLDKLWNPENPELHTWLYPSLLYYRIPGIKLVDISAGNSDSLLMTADFTYIELDGNLRMIRLKNDEARRDIINEFGKYSLDMFWDPDQVNAWLKEKEQP